MRDRALFLLVTALLSGAAVAQQPPVFSPPPGGVEKPPKPPVEGEVKPLKVPPKLQEDPITVQVERLRKWPGGTARQAALVLAGLGTPARARLIAGLGENDWRIQAGSAFALAEMGDVLAVAPLRRAVADKSNRASLPTLMRALVKLDPKGGPEAVLPFLAHSSAKIRVSARSALPRVLGDRYVPDLVALFRSRRTAVRASALELLSRVPGQGVREEFFAALSDPESQVAWVAARHLAERGTPAIRTRLLELATGAPMRQSAYAMLSLVLLEDAHQDALVSDKGAIRNRAQQFLSNDDPFYAGTAALLFANVSYRSSDPTLRKIADDYLVPILLSTVAGGVFFSDYTSLEDLCWKKLGLLSGVDFGQKADTWKTWWRGHEDGFVARRELRSVTPEELRRAVFRCVRATPDGKVAQVTLAGAPDVLRREGAGGPLVMSRKELDALVGLLESSEFFSTQGDRPVPDRLDGSVELELEIPHASMSFKRFHYGPVPQRLRALCAWVETTRADLAWQRLVPPTVVDRAAFLEEQRAFFDAEADPGRRRERILSLAIRAWPGLARIDRGLCVSVFRSAAPDWISAHRPALIGLLRHEKLLTEEAVALIDLLSPDADNDVRSAVLDVASAAPSHRSEAVLRRFLGRQPLSGVAVLMRDDRARVRALAAESLARFDGNREVVGILIQGLKDYESGVQDACLRSLATMKDERIMAMLEAVIASEENRGLKMRAIEGLGLVGRAQAVPRLMELWRSDDERVRWAVIRGLKSAGGRRAIVALAGIVRGSGDVEARKEALDGLTSLGGTDVAERLREILERTKDLDIRVMAIGSLAKVMGARAIPVLRNHLDSEVAEVHRIAALTLARLGAVESASVLLELMSRPEGDLAAEFAFQGLTFHVSYDPSPPRRYQASKLWFDGNGGLTRPEWFLLAAGQAAEGLDAEVDWLDASDLKVPHLLALLRVLQRGNRPVRLAADATLRRASGLPVDPVGRTVVEAEERVGVFRRWLAGRKNSR